MSISDSFGDFSMLVFLFSDLTCTSSIGLFSTSNQAMHTPKSNDGEHGSKPITRNELKETIKNRSDR
jgi:hypothetical protein